MTQQVVAVDRSNAGKHELCQLIKSCGEKAGQFKNREDSSAPLDGSLADRNTPLNDPFANKNSTLNDPFADNNTPLDDSFANRNAPLIKWN